MHWIFSFILTIFLSGCGLKNNHLSTYESHLPSLLTQVQSFQKTNPQNYQLHYFKPWNNPLHVSMEVALWPWNVYTPAHKYYSETLTPRSSTWFKEQLQNAQLEKLGSINQNAIMLKTTDVRNFPTHLPIFKNPQIAGEGFPFDYNQNSRIAVFTPIKLSHYSQDKMWAFIEADSFFGWVEASTIALISKEEQNEFINAPKAVAIEYFNLTHPDGFYTTVPQGTIIPLANKNQSFTFLPNRGKIHIQMDESYIAHWPYQYNQDHLESFSKTFLDEPYGWGGLYGNRDCSAFTKDFFAPFGIWLPRNSRAQFNHGSKIYLKDASMKEKKEMIKSFAIPFLSLIYLPGHIMLYAGSIDGEPLVMHNTWGIKMVENSKESRHIIGKTIISDLHVEKNFSNTRKEDYLLSRIEGFSTPNQISPQERLIKAYPNGIKNIAKNRVYFYNGTTLPFSSARTLNSQNILDEIDIQGQFIHPYPALTPLLTPTTDPGRFRNEEFFKALYGKSQKEIESQLIPVTWLPSHTNQTLLFHKSHGAAQALQKVSNTLDKLPKEYLDFVNNPAGTYNYRTIAQTSRLSMHSFGIAIDINTDNGDYWKWSETGEYQNKIPQKIVEIFESNGFIWGGRWKHFDTFHFEYRPELTIP